MSLNSFRSGLGGFTSTPAGKWTMFGVGGILVFSLVYSGLGNNLGGRGGAGGGAGAASGDAVVETVNGQPITRADFDQAFANVKNQQQMQGRQVGVDQTPFLDDTALEQLTTQSLALQRAQKMGLTASGAEIAQARQRAIQQSQIAQKLNLPPSASVTDINNALAKNGARPVEQIFSDDALRTSIILGKLQATLARPVTEQDARDSFTQYHTRHILIANKGISDVQAQSQAQQVLAKATAPGADFAALANKYTADPGNKDRRTGRLHGGDDGWIDQNTGYVPEFKTAAFALKPGQVTPAPVKSPQFGYFLIKLDGTRENLPKDFDKNKANYIAQVQQQRQAAAGAAFETEIKSDPGNKIVVNDPQLRGDQTLAQAEQGDPSQRPAKLQAAIAAYQQALKTAPAGQAGAINVALALAYNGLKQTSQEIAALKAAVDATHDQGLELALGNLYAQNKDVPNATTQLQAASQQAWDDPQVHQNIAIVYATMKRPELAKKEFDLFRQIQRRHQQAGGPGSGGLPPGGLTLPPGGGAGHTITVRPASGQPTPSAPKPGQ